ncbi:hypothetical protein HPB49_005698 [Dermacentor silvarum]|uniref:Uncharacterized protein n=1 Tax=Dermacentor silvarum TaxID=543639 RepID=A0ACB8DBJ1_DERSI|nr:hypothetical protein HPB49_005698 [Dermacentor silvarum]
MAAEAAQKPDFSYMGDGFFHSTDGFCVSGAQAAKIFGNKKGTLVCKDTAQALWGSAVLATRSVSGNVAPKKRALGELPKPQLTPKKVDVVVAIRHLLSTDELACITEHRLFPLLCLDGDLIEVNRRQLHFYNPTYLEHADRNSSVSNNVQVPKSAEWPGVSHLPSPASERGWCLASSMTDFCWDCHALKM